jgi:PAS domain-containing protein
VPVREAHCAVARIHLASRDITQRGAAEEALRRQTSRLESILASMGDGVVVLDKDRQLIVVNPAARQYIHQNEGEVAPKEWAQKHRTFELDGKTPSPSERGRSRALPAVRRAMGSSS